MIKDTDPMGRRPHAPEVDRSPKPKLTITPDDLIGRLGITLNFYPGDAVNELTAELTLDGITVDKATCYIDPAGYVISNNRYY